MSDTTTRSTLHWQILGGLVLGAILGTTINTVTQPEIPVWVDKLLRYGMEPIGKIFLNLLVMTVVPLVFASLALGVARLGSQGKLGRIGVKTFAYFIITMTAAVIIGLTLVNLVGPGRGLSEETRTQLEERFGGDAKARLDKPFVFGVDTFVNIVPRNPIQSAATMDMLAIIFVALLVGLALTRITKERGQLLTDFLEGISDVTLFIIHLAMRFAPLGVFALIFTTTTRFGFDLLMQLGWYVMVVVVGLAIQMFVVFPVLVSTLGRMNPLHFFQKTKAIMLTAFSTSSSNATLPTTISVSEEELGVPKPVAGFVLPLGATMNMNGTALFEGVTAVFLAQVFGVQLDLTQQIVIVLMCVLTAIGAAGVPGGSIPLMAMILSVAGVPTTAIALILGVDRILDMCRTTVNVMGDVTCAVYIARSEGHHFEENEAEEK